jgi:hypothetical protein
VTNDPEAEALIDQLRMRSYEVVAVLEQTAANRLATVRLRSPASALDDVLVDILFASSGIEGEIADSAEAVAVMDDAIVVPVARTGHLIALQVLARDDRRRPQDWDDLKALFEAASPDEIRRAREALALVEARGFHRGRDLGGAFQKLVDGDWSG